MLNNTEKGNVQNGFVISQMSCPEILLIKHYCHSAYSIVWERNLVSKTTDAQSIQLWTNGRKKFLGEISYLCYARIYQRNKILFCSAQQTSGVVQKLQSPTSGQTVETIYSTDPTISSVGHLPSTVSPQPSAVWQADLSVPLCHNLPPDRTLALRYHFSSLWGRLSWFCSSRYHKSELKDL